jgi:hypothetical protein
MRNSVFNTAFTLIMLQLVVARSFALQSSSHLLPARRFCSHRNQRSGIAIRRSLSNQSESENVETTDKFSEYHNENNIRDQVFSALSADGSIKVTVCTARNLVNDLMIMHTMTATPADALGRAVTCALLMSNGMQDEQTIQLTLKSKDIYPGVFFCEQ